MSDSKDATTVNNSNASDATDDNQTSIESETEKEMQRIALMEKEVILEVRPKQHMEYTEYNTLSSLNTPNLAETKKNRMVRITQYFLENVSEMSSKEDKKILSTGLFKLLVEYLDVMRECPKFVLTVKNKLDELIIGEQMPELIPIYDEMFNDKLYEGIRDESNYPINVPVEFIMKSFTEYNATHHIDKKKIRAIRNAKRYTDGEIVGAKDSEGHWWLSRILKVFNYSNHYIYFVEFCGWEERYNSFLDSTRIEKFNPKKHTLYRGANISKQKLMHKVPDTSANIAADGAAETVNGAAEPVNDKDVDSQSDDSDN